MTRTGGGAGYPSRPGSDVGDAVDDATIRRCLEGDQGAWRELVDAYSGLVFAIARRSGVPDDACDDTVQTVFATLVRRLKDISDREHLTGWLVTTTRRECWRAHRRLSRHCPPGEHPGVPVVTDAGLERLERVQELQTALRRLGGGCEQLLEALFLTESEPSYQQIAARLGISVGSIGPTRRRCLARLAQLLGAAARPERR